MSDRPSDFRLPELKDVVIAVKDVAAEWYELGLQLGLPDATLASIAAHPDIEGRGRMMLSKWLQYDTKASWEKLATALNKIGKNVIAANIRREFVSSVEQQSVEQEAERRQAMAETSLRKIKTRFSRVVIDVQSSMENLKVEVKKVRRFLLDFFDGNCSIHREADLDAIFDSITEAHLWRYDQYGPLEELAETFLPDDDPARAQVTEYKSQLTGFYATTRIIDFVKLNELEDREEIPDRMFSPKKYNSHYQKFTMKLGLARDAKGASELTLEYVDKLWKALMKEFHLPPLTAVMDKIVEGSLTITWLLLPHIIEKIRATYFKSVKFFEQNNIISIVLYYEDNGPTIYAEEWMTGSTPLFRASFAGNIDEVKDLLEGGADVNETNDNKEDMTPLMGACCTGRTDIAKLLLDHKATVDYQDKDGWSAVYYASVYGSTATVMVLMEYGAQVDLLNSNEMTPLMGACAAGSTDAARVLLNHGANVDYCDNEGMSGLMAASGNGHRETVAVLLEYKAQVNLPDQDGWTALAWANDRGYADTARLLLENGATMDFEENIWKKILRYASEQGFSEVVAVMLEYGAPVNLIVDEEEGNTTLGVACENGEAETARVLLNHSALTIDYQNKKGQSALHLASVGGHTQTVAVLIEKGAQLNLQDQDGWTALLLATKQGHLETIKLLLEHGAAIDIESKSGLTAVKVAQSDARQGVHDILLQYIQQGAKVTTPQQDDSESTQEEETAELAEETKEWDTQQESAKVKSPQEGEDDDSQRLPEDTQQKRRDSEKQEERGNNREQQDTNTELTEAQRAEVKSVGERIWEQIKRVFLRELVKKEQNLMKSEQETSEHIIHPTRQRRSMLSFFPRRGRRTRRQSRRPVVGRAPAAEH